MTNQVSVARSFRDLRVWQVGKQLVLELYAVTRAFPIDERFGLAAQIRRAAVSVPSNIAEGYNRGHRKDYRRYLSIALGSCGELEKQFEIACELGYVAPEQQRSLSEVLDHEARMLRTLIRRL